MEENNKKLPYEKAQMQVIEIQSEQFIATTVEGNGNPNQHGTPEDDAEC